MFATAGIGSLNIMGLASANSAVLSALIYNALIIPALIPWLRCESLDHSRRISLQQNISNLWTGGCGGSVYCD